jgi:DNA-damage-inducible protein J
MPTEAIIETHIDAAIKQKAEAIFAAEGLTIDDVVRQMLQKTVEGQCVPMDFFRPNAETVEAMEAARRGETYPLTSLDDLFAELDAED